jgi:tetratricopeptide (TPR) repeat protein
LIRRYWQAWLFTAVLVAGLGVALYRHFAPTPQSMPARAYTVQRPFAFRLPDERYGPVRLKKGSSDLFGIAPELRVAATEIDRRLHCLMNQDYAEALSLLEPLHGQDLANDRVALALSGAYALRADKERENAAADYTRSLDLLPGLRKAHEKDARMLYDVALIWERIPDAAQAAKAWEECLQADGTSGYSAEARKHLGEIQTRLKVRGQAIAAVAEDPARFLELVAGGVLPGSASPDLFLDAALMHWLPRVIAHDEAATRALQVLARLHRERSGDPFLEGIGRGAGNPALAARSFERLARAARLNRSAGPTEGAELAASAARDLGAAGLRAASLRARTEEVYGLHRGTRVEACIARSRALTTELANTPYVWMKAHNLTEQAICLSQAGRFSEAIVTVAEGIDVAAHARLHVTELRARGMPADFLDATGSRRTANREYSDLLATYRDEPVPPNHAHQIFFHWRHLAA